ncbi:hypothetical protein RvY_10331 [Ramazzottius varieornatus]|uniref:Uncharacterized protein n=1 Tax=Ramazzottius varieornatus TaxID=947166 RepID=A0A1D1VCE6_RAMVA|nr:hypothetical protein RvY_10331 [Ramazzottius varieornatus]
MEEAKNQGIVPSYCPYWFRLRPVFTDRASMEPPHFSDTLRTSAEEKASEDEEEENEASGLITYNNASEPEVDFSCGLLELPEDVSPVATSQLITG